MSIIILFLLTCFVPGSCDSSGGGVGYGDRPSGGGGFDSSYSSEPPSGDGYYSSFSDIPPERERESERDVDTRTSNRQAYIVDTIIPNCDTPTSISSNSSTQSIDGTIVDSDSGVVGSVVHQAQGAVTRRSLTHKLSLVDNGQQSTQWTDHEPSRSCRVTK